ncbi:MAG: NAD-dependent malic enzyme, partial [Pseudomonadota bacterium]
MAEIKARKKLPAPSVNASFKIWFYLMSFSIMETNKAVPANLNHGFNMKKNKKIPHGYDLIHHPFYNKGTAFTAAERDALGLRGLLPPKIQSQDDQVVRVMLNFQNKTTDLERYIQLIALHDRNETLFYRVIMDHLEIMMPIIYTPTVGQACQHYGQIFRRPRGLYISLQDKGQILKVLKNWPFKDVRVIVVTDGERILGLGDLGAHGMGIPVGKLSLYTACAGVHPDWCLPITLDVGTENVELREDQLYTGLVRPRLRGAAFDKFFDEFIDATKKVFPKAIIQLEDFANINAFRLTKKIRNKVCSFDDDIQGTAAVAFSGVLSALKLTGGQLKDQKVLFLGAGEAGIGIADLISYANMKEGMTEAQAHSRCWFVDSKALVTTGRTDLNHEKQRYAQEAPAMANLVDVVHHFKPNVIIGVSGKPRLFTQEVVRAMGQYNERPVIFALSNPTSKAECTAQEAYQWTDGRAIFASGSPFDPVTLNGQTFVSGQGNNVYIFPGVGLGAIACEAKLITDEMFYVSATVLAEHVTPEDLKMGRIYPALTRIREVSAAIAKAVAEVAYQQKLARKVRPPNLAKYIKSLMYNPKG